MTALAALGRPAALAATRAAARCPRLAAYGTAVVVYLLALVLAFHVVLLHPGSRLIGGFSDATSTIRDYWAASVQHRTPFTFTHDAYDAAPEGFVRVPATLLANGAIQAEVIWELHGWLGWVGAWNLFMLAGLFATGLATFALLRALGCRTWAAILGGYIFAFSPYALERAYAGHLELLQNWIFVLLVWVLLRYRDRRALGYALATGATLALAFYLSAYQGLLTGFVAIVFFLVELGRSSSRRALIELVGAGALAAASCFALLVPILVLYEHEQALVTLTTAHPAEQFYRFAATLGGYLLPSPRNPLFHWIHWLRNARGSLTEDTLYVGYTTMLLAAAAVVLLERGDAWLNAGTRRGTVVFFALLAPLAFLMSLAPSIRVGPVSIPMPSAILGHLNDFWRVYSRFGLVADLALVVLAALALTTLTRRGGRWRLLLPIASLVVFLEILPGNVPALATNTVPAWVTWLARQPPGLVATYPWYFGSDLPEDTWYQIVDHHPEFEEFEESATQQDTRQYAIRLLTRDIWRPLSAEVMRAEGVRYVIVHEDGYVAAGQGVQIPDPRQYHLVKVLGMTRVYSIIAPPTDVGRALRDDAAALGGLLHLVSSVQYGAGYNAVEQFDGVPSRWMIEGGELELNDTFEAKVTLSTVAFSNATPRELYLEDSSGRVLAHVRIPTYAVKVQFGPLVVPGGETTLRLVATPGPEPLSTTDPREASVFLEQFSVTAVPTFVPTVTTG